MTDKLPYTYTVLRYVHDVTTGEFVNVGVVMHVPSQQRVLASTRTTFGRVKSIFPDLDSKAFISSLSVVKRSFNAIEKISSADGDATTIARRAVPKDDSSLQWSPAGSGLTGNVDETFKRLYERFVAKYDKQSKHRRSDEDVWRPVSRRLEERQLGARLQETVIRGPVDDVVFKHAWKNGRWHVYEPVSFDFADADGIKIRAREWVGHLASVVAGGEAEPFKPYFIIGAPTDKSLMKAYHSAAAILRQAPNEPEIFEEAQVDDLVAKIEDEIRSND